MGLQGSLFAPNVITELQFSVRMSALNGKCILALLQIAVCIADAVCQVSAAKMMTWTSSTIRILRSLTYKELCTLM